MVVGATSSRSMSGFAILDDRDACLVPLERSELVQQRGDERGACLLGGTCLAAVPLANQGPMMGGARSRPGLRNDCNVFFSGDPRDL